MVATIRDRSYASVVISNEIDSLEPRTSYYARLVAINSLGTTYSNVLTFTTVGDIPVVDEPVITNITGNEAHVALSVHPGLLATRSTLQFSTQPNCSLDCTSLPLPTITGTAAHFLDATLTQLHAQTQYFVSVTSSNKLGTVTSTVTTFSTIGSLANGTISSPSVSNTTLTASIAVNTGLLAGSVALEVSATDTFDSIISSTSSAFSSNGPLTHLLTVTGLSAHTNYFIRAAANNELGTTYSVVLPIRTLGGIPVLEYPVASADLQSATLSGDLRTTGLDTFVTAALSTNPDMSQSTEFFVYAGSISHTISLTLHHLASRTTYYATLTASNEMGSSTTAVIPITTRTPVGVLINSGAASTASSTVSLDFTTPTNIAAIRISNYADFSQARVFGAASALDWALLPSNESSALRTVWVQFVLTTGRTVEFSDTITLTATTDPGVSPINNAGTSIVATSKSAAPTISATTTATRTAPITRIVTIKVRKTSSSIVRMQTKTGKKIVTRRISVNKSGKYVIAIPAGVKTMMVRLIDATGKVSNWTSVA